MERCDRTIALVISLWAGAGLFRFVEGAARHVARVERVSTVNMPHHWGVDFVKRGKYLYVTGSESQRKFAVIDAAEPRNMRIVSEHEAGLYAARNLCLHGHTVLVNLYQWMNAIDISDPTRPELLMGCQWLVDHPQENVRPFYRFQWIGNHLFLACSKPERAFRVYEVKRLFLPRLLATVSLSDRLDKACVEAMNEPRNWYPNAEMIVAGRQVHTSLGTYVAGFDVSDPGAPAVTYCKRMPGYVVGLAMAGQTLYVAMNGRALGRKLNPEKGASLAVVDLAGRVAPRIVGQYKGMAVPERIAVDGHLLYLVGDDRIQPADMQVDGVGFTKGLSRRLKYRPSLHVLDVSNPGKPVRRARLLFPLRRTYYGDSTCRAMALDRGVLYVADQEYGIRAVDLTRPSRPKLIGGLRTVTHEVREVIPRGRRLYVANGTGVNAVDISDPHRPRLDREGCLAAVCGWGVSQPVFGPRGRYLYSVASGAYEVVISDFGEPAGPRGRVVNLIPMPDGWGARDLGWADGRLYVLATKENQWSTAAVCVFKPVDSGRGLRLVRSIPIGTFKSWVGWVWGTSYLVGHGRLFVLNALKRRGAAGRLRAEALDLATVDISTPDAPMVHGPVDLVPLTPGLRPTYYNGRALAYRGGTLYLYAIDDSDAQKASWLLAYDVRNPDRPVFAGSLREPAVGKRGFWTRNLLSLWPEPYLACSSESTSAWLVDIRDPHEPTTAWKEPMAQRRTDTGGYDAIAKPAPAYAGGYLYVSRLDRVDIFRLHFRDGPPPSKSARRARVKSALAAAEKASGDDALPMAFRAALRTQHRTMAFFLRAGSLQQAETLADELEQWRRNQRLRKTRLPIARARPAVSDVNVDGRADEWERIPWVELERGHASAKWQWDELNLYILVRVADPAVERSPGRIRTPHCYTGDHVDVFVSALPAWGERAYGPADTHFSIDLSGRIRVHCQNPRVRGRLPAYQSVRPERSRAAVRPTARGYIMELSLAHEDTWVAPMPGAVVACSIVVTDRGDRQMLLRWMPVRGYLRVQPSWPCIELSR